MIKLLDYEIHGDLDEFVIVKDHEEVASVKTLNEAINEIGRLELISTVEENQLTLKEAIRAGVVIAEMIDKEVRGETESDTTKE